MIEGLLLAILSTQAEIVKFHIPKYAVVGVYLISQLKW